MKKLLVVVFILLVVVFILLASVAYAEGTTVEHLCTEFSSLAGLIMEKRQDGIPITRMLESFKTLEGPEETEKMIKEIVYRAYEQPNYQVPEFQQREITRFADEIFIRCIRANSK